MNPITIEQIERIAAELDAAKQQFLRERGWTYTSNTPGCYWLWEKKLDDGRTVLVTGDMAQSMEEYLENIERN